jgi:hypothetical protein
MLTSDSSSGGAGGKIGRWSASPTVLTGSSSTLGPSTSVGIVATIRKEEREELKDKFGALIFIEF